MKRIVSGKLVFKKNQTLLKRPWAVTSPCLIKYDQKKKDHSQGVIKREKKAQLLGWNFASNFSLRENRTNFKKPWCVEAGDELGRKHTSIALIAFQAEEVGGFALLLPLVGTPLDSCA